MIAEIPLEQTLRHFFPQTCCSVHKKHDKRESGCLEKSLGAQRNYVYVARLIVAMTTNQTRCNLAAKD